MAKLRQKDIAQKAGVSPSAVCLLLKDPNTSRVSDATRERVFEILRAHNQVEHLRRASGNILCAYWINPVTQEYQNYMHEMYYASLLMAAERAGQASGHTVVLRSYYQTEELHELSTDPSIAGIISINYSHLAEELHYRKPVVAINSVYTSSCDVVKSHMRGISRDQVSYLHRCGHRRIAFFSTEYDNLAPLPNSNHEGYAAERFSGYFEGLYVHELPVRPEYCLVQHLQRFTLDLEEPSRQALDHFLGLPQPPTAVIAYNDNHAIYLMKAARERGLSLPEDLSIVGNDNIDAGRFAIPPLTTGQQDRAALGQIAVERLVQRLDNNYAGPFQVIEVPVQLVERASVATLTPENP